MMRRDNVNELLYELRTLASKIEAEEQKNKPGAYERLMKDNPMLALKQAEFDEVQRELAAAR